MITVEFCEKQLRYIHEIMQEIREKLNCTEHETHKAYLEQDLKEGENELNYWQRYLDYVKRNGESSLLICKNTNE